MPSDPNSLDRHWVSPARHPVKHNQITTNRHAPLTEVKSSNSVGRRFSLHLNAPGGNLTWCAHAGPGKIPQKKSGGTDTTVTKTSCKNPNSGKKVFISMSESNHGLNSVFLADRHYTKH